ATKVLPSGEIAITLMRPLARRRATCPTRFPFQSQTAMPAWKPFSYVQPAIRLPSFENVQGDVPPCVNRLPSLPLLTSKTAIVESVIVTAVRPSLDQSVGAASAFHVRSSSPEGTSHSVVESPSRVASVLPSAKSRKSWNLPLRGSRMLFPV